MKSLATILFIGMFTFFQQCKEDSKQPDNFIADEDMVEAPPAWPWRGITIVSHKERNKVTETAIQNMAKKGVNLIRLRLSVRKFAGLQKISVQESMESTLAWAEKVIGWADDNNIKILISVTDFPIDPKTDHNQTNEEFWNSETDLAECLAHIDDIVKHFDGFENVVAYEFIAEPVVRNGNKSERPSNWNTFFERILKTIREKSDKYVLYTPGPWGGPGGYADMGEKWKDERIIYNFHFYRPHRYTHQGVGKNDKNYEYPGWVYYKNWDKEALEKEVRNATNWAAKNNAKYLFAGEFSVVRWAEGKDKYLQDLLSIFESNNISWAYFSFNGWRGWDYEMEPDTTKNDSKILKKNQRNNTAKILENFWGINLKKSE